MKYSWLTSLILVLFVVAPLQAYPQEPAPEDPGLPDSPPAAPLELELPAAPSALPSNRS
jgi:hypothetical protein